MKTPSRNEPLAVDDLVERQPERALTGVFRVAIGRVDVDEVMQINVARKEEAARQRAGRRLPTPEPQGGRRCAPT
ncbi:hypothetical protein GPA22_15570 [Aromatoleum toluvorans]|uniref:Uncharacterized protein n=1 Tax=Aromatoleum toluvorans TaxID=92002 RepID=A0ABX1Q3S5_9RHOO|nr:hypothetical protein [Aromatoleum toluvorans]NMG45140.1 hypothetical protein [Aromatoleum toluvorans]